MTAPPPIQIANLGMADSLILMVMALVVFGPRRLPQIGRQIGKLMYEFRKASNDFKFQMEEELRLSEEADRRKKEEEKRKQQAQESVAATPAVVQALASSSAAETQSHAVIASESITSSPAMSGPTDEAPRIQPPSTGETVAAGRSELAELTEPPPDSAPGATTEATVSPTPNSSHESSPETVSHND
jgi:sec-independent protein translocase protein TatB